MNANLSDYVTGKYIPNTPLYKYGVEIEVEEFPYKDYLEGGLLEYWVVDEDASLRNNGKELISVPFDYKLKDTVLETVDSLVGRSQANTRCGVHVHASVEALTLDQFKSLCLLYSLYEPIFFMVSGFRNANAFCLPVSESFIAENLKRFLACRTIPGLCNVIKDYGQKYYAFNILPVINNKQCTVEFRHHKGTTDVEDISKFITLIKNLFEKMYNNQQTSEELLTSLCNINTVSNYEELARDLLKETGYDLEYNSSLVRSALRKSAFNLRVVFDRIKL